MTEIINWCMSERFFFFIVACHKLTGNSGKVNIIDNLFV